MLNLFKFKQKWLTIDVVGGAKSEWIGGVHTLVIDRLSCWILCQTMSLHRFWRVIFCVFWMFNAFGVYSTNTYAVCKYTSRIINDKYETNGMKYMNFWFNASHRVLNAMLLIWWLLVYFRHSTISHPFSPFFCLLLFSFILIFTHLSLRASSFRMCHIKSMIHFWWLFALNLFI